MRIFELAKALKMASNDVLRQAQALELEACSTLSRLDDDDIRVLKNHYAKASAPTQALSEDAQARLAAKRERAAQKQQVGADAERKALSAAIGVARKLDSRRKGRSAAPVAAELPPAAIQTPATTYHTPAVPHTPAVSQTPAAAQTPATPQPPVASGESSIPTSGEPMIDPAELKIESLPPIANLEEKVIIHAESTALELEEKADEAQDDARAPAEEELDPDEELASAYLGRRAQLPPPAKAHAMRPKESREPDLPRSAPGKGGRAAAPASRHAAAAQEERKPATPAAKRVRGTAPNVQSPREPQGGDTPAAPASGRTALGSPIRGHQPIIRGHQPIVRGQPPIIRGQPPIARGQPLIARGQPSSTRGHAAKPAASAGRAAAATGAAQKPRFAPVATGLVANTDKVLQLRGPTLVKDLAEMMGIRVNRLIADLMQLNVLVSINQRVDIEKAGRIAEKYGYTVELERTRRSSSRKPAIRRLDAEDDIPEDQPEDMKPRPPVVTFLGHVDHGKTSLMDRIRQTQVVTGEAGGITQHIGAYSVELAGRKITFLDTPGHAAFSAMRARGANLTDIAVVIIAADDGIMPQTREVIKQAQQAEVQVMVAINKCDLPAAKPERVRQQLQAEGLTPEEWGGDLVVCEVSAATGKGVDHLLEMILLQADMLELQSNPDRRADGYVIEAQLELGLGPTATLLVSSGTLKMGNVVLIGEHFGRLRGLMDDRGRKVLTAGPATAVRVMGLSGVPEPGAEFRVMVNEKRARELAEQFSQERKEGELSASSRTVTLDNLLDKLNAQKQKQLSVIIKGDTQGSVEAIVDSLRDIHSAKISLDILNTGIGNVATTDVQRACAGNAILLGFQVGLDTGVAALARHDKVRVHTFRIIYELFDYVKQAMLDLIEPEFREVVRGHAQIRAIFDISKKGRIAGCQLLDGVINTKFRVRIKRVRDVIFDGRIDSLRHFQNEVAEVRDMQECGIFFTGFQDFAEGDIVECYEMEELERTL